MKDQEKENYFGYQLPIDIKEGIEGFFYKLIWGVVLLEFGIGLILPFNSGLHHFSEILWAVLQNLCIGLVIIIPLWCFTRYLKKRFAKHSRIFLHIDEEGIHFYQSKNEEPLFIPWQEITKISWEGNGFLIGAPSYLCIHLSNPNKFPNTKMKNGILRISDFHFRITWSRLIIDFLEDYRTNFQAKQ